MSFNEKQSKTDEFEAAKNIGKIWCEDKDSKTYFVKRTQMEVISANIKKIHLMILPI